MSDDSDWKKQTVTAVNSATTIAASSTASGLTSVTDASLGVTLLIVNNFNFTSSPEAVSDESYRELEVKVTDLEARIEAESGANSSAFKCKEDFERHWQAAKTKAQKFNCLTAYLVCLGQGFTDFTSS